MQNSSNGPDGEPRGHRMPQPPPLLSQSGTSTAPNHQSTRDGVPHSTSDSNLNPVLSQSVDAVSQQLQTQDVQPVTFPAHINAILSKCMNQKKSRHNMQTSERKFCGYHKNQRNNSVEFFNITVTKCTVGGEAIHSMSDVPLPYHQCILDTDNLSTTCDPTTSDYSQYAYDCPEWSQNTRISNHSQVPPDRPAIRQAAARRTGDPELQLIVASLQNSPTDTIKNPLDLSRKREPGEEILYKVLEETTSGSATDGDMSNIQVTYDGEGRKEQTQSTGNPEVAFVPESYMYTNARNISHAIDLSQNSSKPPTGIQHIPKESASKPIYRNGSETTNQQSHLSELSYATFARNLHPYETTVRPGSNMMAHIPEPSIPGPSQRRNKTPPRDPGNPNKSSSWPRPGPHIKPTPGLLSNSKPSHRSHPEVAMRRPPYVPYQQSHLPPQPYPYRHHLNIPYHHPVNQQVHNQGYPRLPLDTFRPTGGYASGRPVYYPHNTTAPSPFVHPKPMWSPSLRGDHADAGPQERHASSTSQQRPLMQSWHPTSPAQPPSHSVFTPWSELAKLSASRDQWPSKGQPHDSHMKQSFQAQHPTVTHQLSLISVTQSLSQASAIWNKLEQESPSEKPQSESPSSMPQSPSEVPQSPSEVPQSPSAIQQSPSAVLQSPSAVLQSPSAVLQSPSAVPQSPSLVSQSPSSVPQSPSSAPQSPSSVQQSPSSVPQSTSSVPQSPSSVPQSPSSVPQSPLSFVPSSPLSVQQSPSSILQSPSSVPQSQSSKPPSSDSDDSLPKVEMPHLLALFNSAPIHKEAKSATSKPSLQSKHSDEQNVPSNEETKPRRPTTSHKEAKSATSKTSLQSKHSDEQNVSSNEETKPRGPTTSHKEAKSATSKPPLQSRHSDEQNVPSNEETKHAETDKNGGSNRAINNLKELRHLLLEHEENTGSQISSSRRPQNIGPYDYKNPQMAYYWDCMQTTLPSPFDKRESIMSPYAGMSTSEVRERNQGITQQSPTKRRQEDNPGDSLVLKKRQMTDWLDNLENEGRCELIDTDGENSRGSDVFERVNGWGARQPLLTTTQRQGMETVDNAHKLTISPQPLEELALFTAKMVGPQGKPLRPPPPLIKMKET